MKNRFNIREVFSKIKTSGFKKIKRLKQAASKVRFLFLCLSSGLKM